jgi:hypothetical protein
MSETSPTYCPPHAGASRHVELTLKEPDLRRLQTAIESIASAESIIRRGMHGESQKLVYAGLETLMRAILEASEVMRQFRNADLRPEMSEAYLAQAIDDLLYVECQAEEVDLPCSEGVRSQVVQAREHLNNAVRCIHASGVRR